MEKTKLQNNKILSLVLSYVLSLLLVLLAILGSLTITVCNRNFLKTQVLKSGFCPNVLQELHENYISYGAASGFSADVMRQVVNADTVQSDMFKAIERFYDGDRTEQSYPEIGQKAYEIFAKDVQTRNYKITPEVQEGLEALANACAADYANYVRIPFTSYLAPLLAKLQANIWLPLMLIGLFTAVCTVLLFMAQSDKDLRLRYSTYSLSAAMLLCGVFPVFAKSLIRMDRVHISPESIKLLAGGYANGIFTASWYFAVIYGVAVAALAITLYLRAAREKKFYVQKDSALE